MTNGSSTDQWVTVAAILVIVWVLGMITYIVVKVVG